MAVKESCGYITMSEWDMMKRKLESEGCKKRYVTFYPDSLGCEIDSDRILHVIPQFNGEKVLVRAEIESNPKHLAQHLILRNGFSRPGACLLMRKFLDAVQKK